MKIIVLALLALAASGAFAQDWGQEQPTAEWAYYGSLNHCAEFLRQQCTMVTEPPFLRSRMWQPSSCLAMQQHCCLQLRHVEPLHRCQEVCSLVRAVAQQQGSELTVLGARNLPAMCGLYLPSYCTTPCAIATGGGACC